MLIVIIITSIISLPLVDAQKKSTLIETIYYILQKKSIWREAPD
jgi:hypothetical protein